MVSTWLKNGTNLMVQRQSTIMSAAGILMTLTLGSALLGLYKQHALAALYTVSSARGLDAFTAAFRLPDLVFQMVIAGGLNAAFIPVFGEMTARKHGEDAWRLAARLMNLTLVVFAGVALLVLLFANQLVYLVSPGYGPDELALIANLTRVMMISPILLGVSAFLSGGLQVHHRFLIPALAPILYNLGIIAGIVWLYPYFGVWGLTYGVIFGSLLHLSIQIPVAWHLGFHFSKSLRWKDAVVQRVGKLMLPRTVGLSIDQLESQVATVLVSTLGPGAMFLYARVFSIVTLPISFFGISIAQAAFPTLSREAAQDKDAFRQTLLTTFHQILYLIVPVAVLLTVLKLPVVRIILNYHDWTSTLVTAQVLLAFAPMLVAQSALHLWVRGFYALKDTVSPIAAAAAGVIASVFISVVTLPALGMRGLGIGMTVGSFVSLVVLVWLMSKRLGGFGWANLYLPVLRIALSGAIMTAAVYLPIKPIEAVFLDTSRTIDLIFLSALVSWFGLSLYLLVSWILGSEEIVMFIRLAHKVRSWRETITKVPAAYQDGFSAEINTEPEAG